MYEQAFLLLEVKFEKGPYNLYPQGRGGLMCDMVIWTMHPKRPAD